MTLLVRTVIEAARDAHPTFRPEKHPDPVLVRFLDRFQDQVANEIAQTKRTALARTFEILTDEHDFDDGDEISEYLEVNERSPIAIAGAMIPAESNRIRGVPVPVVEVPAVAERANGFVVLWHADRIRLVGGETTWQDIEIVEIDYFPRPASLSTRASEIDLPGAPSQVLEAAAAEFMGRRSPADAGVDKRDLKDHLRSALESYLDETTGRRRAQVSQIRDSY